VQLDVLEVGVLASLSRLADFSNLVARGRSAAAELREPAE